MTARDSRPSRTDTGLQRPHARKSNRGYEIYLPDDDEAWIATDTTVPLNDAR